MIEKTLDQKLPRKGIRFMKAKLSSEPVYNIKSVSEQTGIPPVTLRAWERRYEFPLPYRTETGYRLYSEYDIAAVNWLKGKTEGGMTIAQAVKLLLSLIERGENPLVKGMAIKNIVESDFQSIEQVQPALVEALIRLDETEARRIMEYAFNMYTLEQVMIEVIQPTMVEVGDRWHAGEISVATEHFSSNLCRLFLLNAYEMTAESAQKGSIVAACAPGELHELGLLMLTVLLRAHGWNVLYLGANIHLERFAETVFKVEPQLLLFSATTEETANTLMELIEVLDEMPEPRPVIGLGGQAFITKPSLANRIPGTILGPNAEDSLRQIETMLTNN